jgi:CBS domain-containing protein
MQGRRIGCLPIVEHSRVVGIVTDTDVLGELGRGLPFQPAAFLTAIWAALPASIAGRQQHAYDSAHLGAVDASEASLDFERGCSASRSAVDIRTR